MRRLLGIEGCEWKVLTVLFHPGTERAVSRSAFGFGNVLPRSVGGAKGALVDILFVEIDFAAP